MVINKGAYIFSTQHGDRLKRVLCDRSVAFNFHSFESYRLLETTGVKETGKLTEVTFYKDLLPRHCKLELVEGALASLEMFPNNAQLLTTFVDYIENSFSEHAGYSFINGVTWGLLVTCIVVDVPLALSIAVCAFVISNILYDDYWGKKLGIWVGELREGSDRKPVNLEELEANLIALVGNCTTAENIGEAAYREPLATINPSAPSYSFFHHYPSLATEYQELDNNKHDNVRDYPRESLCRGY
ncbi:peptidase U62 modulator of DNA gyrase [Candidatus Rickettsiella viridis]|uniref:Peptidase U62 modulator of DNA gyrase n=1 Tax=Candidatus Rickettsiella viridis TaxID=676208 RepID=A0A2Z5UUM7_9COXI|nr:hypothetical protein [Candidatus Rickettsiella viridis]BBB15198.1 peptidase U62 modulator of DNA gyrase [Candidatus Rickettsiella viridis]